MESNCKFEERYNSKKIVDEFKSTDFKVMLFDLVHTGHHASYIQYLVEYWVDNELPGKLIVLVSPKFTKEHQSVVKFASIQHNYSIEFICVSDQEFSVLEKNRTIFGKVYRKLREWHLLCKYAALLKVDHCMIMYLDTCEVPLLLKLQPPCKFSGIYFRPTFHYRDFENYKPTQKERFRQVWEKLFVHQTLHNPKLSTLFCLDPLVDKSIKDIYPSARAIPLADPVKMPTINSLELENLKIKHNISQGRKIFLLFGSIDERKGIYKILDSLEQLAPALCRRICLLIVGRANDLHQSALNSKIKMLCENRPVKIVTHFEFITDSEVQTYFQLSDVVLALYQKHVGMSGILLLAAASERPVLSTNYGLMGELVKRYKLGLTVDSSCTQEIAKGLTQILSLDQLPFDSTYMKKFAEANSTKKFAKTVFDNLCL